MAENIEKGFNSWLRKRSRQPAQSARCSLCGLEIPNATETSYGSHVREDHADVLGISTLDEKDADFGPTDLKIKALWAKAEKISG